MTINSHHARKILGHTQSNYYKGAYANFSIADTLKKFTLASVIYIVSFLLLACLSSFDLLEEQFSLIGLHLIAAMSLYIYWRLEAWGNAKYDSFGAILLLVAISFNLLNALDTLFYGTRFDEWPITIMVDSTLLSMNFKGEAITFYGNLLVTVAWRLTVQGNLVRLGFLRSSVNFNNLQHFKWLYKLCLFLALIFYSGFNFGALQQLVNSLYLFGTVSIYFIAYGIKPFRSTMTFMYALAMGIPLSFLNMTIGSKEYIILPLIPACIIAWNVYSSYLNRLLIVMLCMITFALSQVYVQYVRETEWLTSDKNFSTTQMIIGAIENYDDNKISGFESIMSRTNLSPSHAITVALAERDGFIPVEVFGVIPAGFIPRILWPDKPIMRIGAEHTQRIRGTTQDLEDVSSSTAAGFFTEMYLGGSLIAVMIFSLLYGFLVGRIQLSFLANQPSTATNLFSFILFYNAIRLDEHTVGYSYTGVIISYISIILIFKILALMPFKRRRW